MVPQPQPAQAAQPTLQPAAIRQPVPAQPAAPAVQQHLGLRSNKLFKLKKKQVSVSNQRGLIDKEMKTLVSLVLSF